MQMQKSIYRKPQGADLLLPLSAAKAGRNHLSDE